MIILKILGILLIIICILLFFPIVFILTSENGHTDFELKFAFFAFKNINNYISKKPTKTKKEKNKKKSTKKSQIPIKEEKNKCDIKKILKLTLYAINSGSKSFAKLVKGVKIYDIEVYFVVASTNAYKTALKFAKVEGAFHANLAVLNNVLKINLKKVTIEPNFISEQEIYDYKLKIKVKPITILFCLIYFVFTFGYKYIKENTLQD